MIEIRVTADTMAEAMAQLGAIEATKTEPKKRQKREKPQEAPATEEPEAAGEPQEAVEEQPEAVEEPWEAAADVPDVVTLREAAKAKGTDKEAKEAIKALIEKHGGTAVSKIPEANRAAFLEELNAL